MNRGPTEVGGPHVHVQKPLGPLPRLRLDFQPTMGLGYLTYELFYLELSTYNKILARHRVPPELEERT